MGHVGYILNLSTSFNAGNFMYYFLPGIASGKILNFQKLTEKQLPANNKNQLNEINNRAWELKNHWDLYKLNPNNTNFSLKINIVLDSSLWLFTGYGNYSRLAFVKLDFIKTTFNKLFTKQELDQISFQYFLIKNKNSDLEETISIIDEHEGILPNNHLVRLDEINTDSIAWPTCLDFKSFVTKEYNVAGKSVEDSIDSTLLARFEEDVDSLANSIKKGMFNEQNTEAFNSLIAIKLANIKTTLLTEIHTNADLNNEDKKRFLIKTFFRSLSTAHYLRPIKDFLFRFTIDLSNTPSKIKSYEQLTAFLVESVDFFGQEDPINFLTCGGNKPSMKLNAMSFNEKTRDVLFEKYQSFSQVKENGEKAYTATKTVKYYNFNTEINPEAHYQIDEVKVNDFIYVSYLNKQISPFYTKAFVAKAKKILASNSLDEIENFIKIQAGRVSASLELDGDYGLSSNSEELTFKEVEQKLKELKDEERTDKLKSTVNVASYESVKATYQEEIIPLHKDLINKLGLLPTFGMASLFFALLFVFSYLLFSPIYSFDYWMASGFITSIFIGLLLVAALGVWFYLRSKIKKQYELIKHKNQGLYNAFSLYVQSLKDLAVSARSSTLRRKNIDELTKVYQVFKKEESQQATYTAFYTTIYSQLCNNGYQISSNEEVLKEPDYQNAPFFDYRIPTQRQVTDFTIKHGNSTRNYPEDAQQFTAVLGVIKSIEFS